MGLGLRTTIYSRVSVLVVAVLSTTPGFGKVPEVKKKKKKSICNIISFRLRDKNYVVMASVSLKTPKGRLPKTAEANQPAERNQLLHPSESL